MLDAYPIVQMLLALGVLTLGCVALGELPRQWLAPIWWPMLFGFLLREFAWEPFWGMPGFGAVIGTFEGGYAPTGEFLFLLGNIGVFLYLFREGLHPHADSAAAGKSATRFSSPQVWLVAVMGLVIPFALGLGFCDLLLGIDPFTPAALLVGVSLTATSIAASAKILESQMQRNRRIRSSASDEATGRLRELRREVMSAAVIDDFVGLLMLLMVIAYVTGEGGSTVDVVVSFLTRTGVVFGAIVVGATVVIIGEQLPTVRYASDLTVRDASTLRLLPLNTWRTKGIIGLLLIVVAASEYLRVSGLVAAYLFGRVMMWLSDPDKHREMALIRAEISQIAGLMLPIYFTLSGMMVSSALVGAYFTEIMLLTVLAVLAKWIGTLFGALLGEVTQIGNTGLGKRLWKASLVFGPAMVPRGEVALVVVNIGYVLGAFDEALLTILLMTVVLTTFVGPIMFKLALRRWSR